MTEVTWGESRDIDSDWKEAAEVAGKGLLPFMDAVLSSMDAWLTFVGAWLTYMDAWWICMDAWLIFRAGNNGGDADNNGGDADNNGGAAILAEDESMLLMVKSAPYAPTRPLARCSVLTHTTAWY